MTQNVRTRRTTFYTWAIALILAGGFLLVFNLGLLAAYEPTAQYVVAIVLGVIGGGFLLAVLRRPDQWWQLLPGWTLLALAGMLVLTTRPDVPRAFVAATLFVGLGLAFANVYLTMRGEHWWAIIPGGFMFVIAAVIGLSTRVSNLETLGTLLFMGMGVVFFLVYLLAGKRRHWWALIPGMVLLLFGVFTYTIEREVDAAMQDSLLRWWPAGLIVLGAILAYLGASARPARSAMEINTAPRPRPERDRDAPHRESSRESSEETEESGRLGEYSRPAPGASVDIVPAPDDRR